MLGHGRGREEHDGGNEADEHGAEAGDHGTRIHALGVVEHLQDASEERTIVEGWGPCAFSAIGDFGERGAPR